MAKTYYIEKHGIRVDGHRNVTEARKAWEAARDEFVDRSTACPPWVFSFRGYVAIVHTTPHKDAWSYTIVTPEHTGARNGTCFYNAPSQIAAICFALGAMVQSVWTIKVPDDAELFDEMCRLARVTDHEARHERSQFLHVAAFWRQHRLAA